MELLYLIYKRLYGNKQMKRIMILGASVYQVPLIKKAKELGLYTIVCSINGEYPGFLYADKVYHVSTTDREQILDIANIKFGDICGLAQQYLFYWKRSIG